MADPLVQEWHSRDLDSLVTQREVDAVNDWLTTNKTFQIMRDNPLHFTEILGGSFGMQFTEQSTTCYYTFIQSESFKISSIKAALIGIYKQSRLVLVSTLCSKKRDF